MEEIFNIREYSFVSDKEVLQSKEYDEMFKEIKDELNSQKVDEIVKGIKKISIDNSAIYKVTNKEEFIALAQYFLFEYEMELENEPYVDFSGNTILIDNAVDSFVHVYSGENLKKFEKQLKELTNFIKE